MMNKSIALRILGALFLFASAGCDEGNEGDRCNPDLSHDECSSGLTCQQPFTCVESYCCPSNLSSASNVYCNGRGCPAPADAGADGD